MALANPGGRTRGVLKLCKLEPGEPDGILTTILEVRSQRRRRQSTRTAGDGTVVLGATSTMAGTPFGERVVTPKTREGTACYAGRHVSPHRTPQHSSLPASTNALRSKRATTGNCISYSPGVAHFLWWVLPTIMSCSCCTGRGSGPGRDRTVRPA